MTVKCQICNTEYKHCPECDKANSYRKVADNPTCYKIYMVLYELRTGIIDNARAKEELATIGVTTKTLRNFKLIDAVYDRIAEIVKEETVEVTVKSEEAEDEVKTFKKFKKENK